MADIFGCEPLRVWCRLEPRARTTELDVTLRAEIADAAWMLGRQWQFGELNGEDSGSAVLAKLAARTASLKQVRLGPANAAFSAYADDVPLEVRVEREASHREDLRARARAGHALLAFLDAAGKNHDDAGGVPPYDSAQYRQLLRTLYPFAEPASPPADTAERVRRVTLQTNVDAMEVLAALSGRAVDALQLFDRLPPGVINATNLPSELALGVIPGHTDLVLAALRSFQAWCLARFGAPEESSAWDDSGLEYRFACQVPHPAGGQLELSANEYTSGRLDWYAFDVGAYALSATVDPSVEVRRASVIPAPAEFPGMPLPRFWQMEDGTVDLGHLTVDTTDIAKVVVAEFALLFGNNWFVQPWSQPAGTLARVDGVVVTDVFGQRTLVRPSVKPDEFLEPLGVLQPLLTGPADGPSGRAPLSSTLGGSGGRRRRDRGGGLSPG